MIKLKKRIYRKMLALLLLCIAMLTTAVCVLFYRVTKEQEIAAIQDRAVLIGDLLNKGINKIHDGDYQSEDGVSLFADFISQEKDSARMAIISPDGTVLLDNKTYAETLPKHDDREEVIEALENGTGEAMRDSQTVGNISYYYAIRLDDGNVLRISKPVQNIIGVFYILLPGVLGVSILVIFLAIFLARKLTRNILAPVYASDLGGQVDYEELAPYVHKINEQKKQIDAQMQDLRSRAQLIESIAENMKEGLLYIHRKGNVLSANVSACNVFDESELVGKNILNFCRDFDMFEEIKSALSGKEAQFVLEKDGKIYQCHCSPVYDEKTIAGIIILMMDVTDKNYSEMQRKEFSANVSHEMKTPLTTISALAEMIETGMVKEEDISNFAAKISAQAKRLVAVIEDIIKLSEFDEGYREQEKSEINIHQIAQNALNDLKEKSAERGITMSLDGARPVIAASRRLLDELIYNLVDNAIKYNRESGTVTVSIEADMDGCTIAVSDTGIGIAPEHQDRIFERFYRVDLSRSKKTGGTGLGLSIVKHIGEYYNGRTWVESREDHGTTIFCRLNVPVLDVG